MARPVWTGSISFGLVNVPVKAYTAVRAAMARDDARLPECLQHFRQIRGGDLCNHGQVARRAG